MRHHEDTLLMEFEKANELCDSKRLVIYPVLIGDRTRKVRGTIPRFDFSHFGGHKFPDHVKTSSLTGESIRDTMNSIFAHQGVFLATDTEALGVYQNNVSLKEESSDEDHFLADRSLCSQIMKVFIYQLIQVAH